MYAKLRKTRKCDSAHLGKTLLIYPAVPLENLKLGSRSLALRIPTVNDVLFLTWRHKTLQHTGQKILFALKSTYVVEIVTK